MLSQFSRKEESRKQSTNIFLQIHKYVLDIHDMLCIVLSKSIAETLWWN